MQRIYQSVHREKAWVRFGISPFGLGRPDRRPPGITGFSQYDKLYADVETWMERGWLDYLAPQLYWPIDQPAQAFGVLQQYWLGQNPLQRHVWPGLFTSRIDASEKSWQAEDILNQINLTRARAGALGHVHFSMAALLQNRKGIADQLRNSAYLAPALIPAAAWLGNAKLRAPGVIVSAVADTQAEEIGVGFAEANEERAWKYAIWLRDGGGWHFSVKPNRIALGLPMTGVGSFTLRKEGRVRDLIVIPIDRFGNEGEPAYAPASDLARLP
ncbi:MAG: family 10 glycosylhydrolase [Betaproteobacteria bacterium]|nr:family 10 glycosylhydrolase [Betaproteobacteria bacterium]